MPGKAQRQVTKGLIRNLTQGLGHKLRHGQFVRLVLLTRKQKPAQLRQDLVGPGPGIVMRRAGPQRILIKLVFGLSHPPKDHGPQASVSHGQGLHPFVGRPVIPERQF